MIEGDVCLVVIALVVLANVLLIERGDAIGQLHAIATILLVRVGMPW